VRRTEAGREPISPELSQLIRDLQAYFQGKEVMPEVRMDLSGVTPFQAAVYEAARRIPRGSVRTYGEIARAIGRPRAARAVGQALGRNPLPVVIPCHRVVAAEGLGGFSASRGTSLKRRMLALEGADLPSIRRRENGMMSSASRSSRVPGLRPRRG